MIGNGLAANQRRLTPKGRATRDRIVAVAAQLMFEHGVGSTTLADVQEAAGVGASQVYHYFRDKQSLVKAVIAYNTDAVPGTVRPRLGWTAWTHCELGGTCLSKRSVTGTVKVAARSDRWSRSWPRIILSAGLAGGFDQWEAAVRDGLQSMRDRGDLRRKADLRSFGCSPSGCGSRRHPACAAAPRPISP